MCRVFGHKHSLEDLVILGMKCVAENSDDLDLSITCLRCGHRTDVRAEVEKAKTTSDNAKWARANLPIGGKGA